MPSAAAAPRTADAVGTTVVRHVPGFAGGWSKPGGCGAFATWVPLFRLQAGTEQLFASGAAASVPLAHWRAVSGDWIR